MLGIDLDRLRQRELQRRHRRMVIGLSTSLVLTGVMAVLAVTAFIARDEASKRQQQAEGILEFMVGDLRTSLDPLGRLDLMEKLGEEAMGYFAAVDLDSLSDEELLRQAEVIMQLGEIRFAQLNYEQALAAFTEAYNRASTLYNNDPTDGERLFVRGQTEFWVGYVSWQTNAFDHARGWLNRYLKSSQTLSELDPTRDDWLMEVGYGYHNLATLEVMDLHAGSLDLALQGFEQSEKILRELQSRNPMPEHTDSLIDNRSWQAQIAMQQGEIEKSRDIYLQCAQERRELIENYPDNTYFAMQLGVELNNSASAALLLGQRETAERLAEEAYALNYSLSRKDRSNISRLLSWLSSNNFLAQLSLQAGRFDEASSRLATSLRELEELDVAEESASELTKTLLNIYLLKSELEQERGNTHDALTHARKGGELATQLLEQEGLTLDVPAQLLNAFLGQALQEQRSGDAVQAQELYAASREVLDTIGGRRSPPAQREAEARLLYHSGIKRQGESKKTKIFRFVEPPNPEINQQAPKAGLLRKNSSLFLTSNSIAFQVLSDTENPIHFLLG
jgi:tetratricopeptide (TPR) repeat protein